MAADGSKDPDNCRPVCEQQGAKCLYVDTSNYCHCYDGPRVIGAPQRHLTSNCT